MTLAGGPLQAADFEMLARSGIDAGMAERALIRRVNSIEGGVLVGRNGGGDYSGLAFPYVWPGELHVREYRLRRDVPDFEYVDGRRRDRGKYLAPPGRGNLLYIPPGTDARALDDPSIPLLLTEGEKKALALSRLSELTPGDLAETPQWIAVAVSGVWNFRGTVGKEVGPKGERRDIKGVIADLERITWRKRKVTIVFDANVRTNESVQAAQRELARELSKRGAQVYIAEVPEITGVNGVDDLIGMCGPARALEIIRSARRWKQQKSASIGTVDTGDLPPLTELGNCERLVKRYGTDFRHVGPRGVFIVYDGRRYQDDQLGQMERWAKFTVREIYAEAARIDDTLARKATSEWAGRSERAAQIAAMLRLAASEPGVPVLPTDLDKDPWILNVANGTIDLRTGTRRPHSQADLITRLAPVPYDPSAKCPRWQKFLSEVFAPHPDVIPFLQRFVGYSLTADTREECLLLLYGTGRNGKGTLLKILAAMLGDYAGTADFSTFVTARDDRGPRDDIANMLGKRFIAAQEAREGAPLAESIIKWLTGGDRVRARKLHENSYEFDPTWKIWLASNYKPTVKGTDPAIWSRLRLVPFDVTFEGREDRTLKTALMDELPGILAWSVEGAMQWQEEGLPTPESVTKATGEYRSGSDQVGRFIGDRCLISESVSALGRDLYAAYKAWAQEIGEPDMKETVFGRRLGDMFAKRHTERGKLYAGVGLKVDG